MKKVFALLLAVALCLPLCGCDFSFATGGEAETTSGKSWVTMPAVMQTEPTEPLETEPSPTEPAPTEPELVTVYLLESAQIYDSGRMEYIYDEEDNIISIKVYTIENDLMFTTYFEECDLDGIPGSYRVAWEMGGGDSYKITYTDYAKITDIEYVGGNFTGNQFEYDQQRRVTEQRSYYEGILEEAAYFEYDGDKLVNSYCTDVNGNLVYECRVENGLIKEYIYSEDQGSSRRLCEYDEAGNLLSDSYIYDGETVPGTFYKYRAVQVDARRAIYLVGQQVLAMWVS